MVKLPIYVGSQLSAVSIQQTPLKGIFRSLTAESGWL
jgi:hypothetical protein